MIANANRLPRRGASFLEFTGCFAALVGGVCLGSMYLGVNVKELAYTALERGHIIEPRRKTGEPTDAELQAAATTTIDTATTEPAPATTASASTAPATIKPAGPAPAIAPSAPPESSVASTPATTPAAADAAATPAAPAPAAGIFAREDLITDQQREVLTKAYWESLAVCMNDEVTHRVPAVDADGNWQLFDYLTGRKEGHKKAAVAIAALDPRGVDDHVMAYAKKCHAWHEDGAKLFGRAVDLLTDAPTAQLSGPFAQSWQSAATQHRMEARLLVEKQQAVQSYLDHTYTGAATAPAPNAAAAATAPPTAAATAMTTQAGS